MSHPNKKRLRRSMMFLNAQKPSLIKDPYLYGADSLMLDLEDAVAVTAKDTARFSLYQALKNVDYRGCERVVRINGLDTEYWKEDIRCAVAGGADVLRIPKTEDARMVKAVEDAVLAAEREFNRPEGSTLLMAALESAKGVMNAYEVCTSSERMIGIALSGGDYTKDLQTKITGTGVELMGARQHMIIAARAAASGAARDIHERDEDYLVRCHRASVNLAARCGWQRVRCSEAGEPLSREAVHEKIYEAVRRIL